jgi:hypothetical protein
MRFGYIFIGVFFNVACKQQTKSGSAQIENTKVAIKDSSKEESWEEAGLPEPEFVTDPAKKQIVFVPDTLHYGDTLVVRFKTPHFRDLAIYGPDDSFFFLVYAQYNEGGLAPIYDYHKFADMESISLPTVSAKANPWHADINEHRLIFTKTGSYSIHLSENLETDDGTPVEIEKFYYIHNKQ